MTSKAGYIIGGVAVLLVAAYLYHEGKKDGSVEQATLPPDDTHGVPETEAALLIIASDIFRDLQGANINGHNMAPYERALSLSNFDFVRLYNLWNNQYSKKIISWWETKPQSLTMTLVEEWDIISFGFVHIKNAMLIRLASLNCV